MDSPLPRAVLLCVLSLALLSSGSAGDVVTPAAASDAVDAGIPTTETVGVSDGSTNVTGETSTATTETLAGTTETVDGVTDTVDGTTETVEDTTNDTTDAVDETTNTTDGLGDTVDGTTDGVEDTVNDTTDAVDATVDGTTGELDDTVEETIDELDDAVDEAADDLAETADPTSTDSDGRVEGVTYALQTPSTADGGPKGTTHPEASPRSESATPAPGDASDGDRGEHAVAKGGGTPSTWWGVGAAVNSFVVVAVLSTSLAATGGTVGTGPPAWSQTGRAVLRALRAGVDPWRHVLLLHGSSRYDDADPLEHDRRRTIYEHITDDPGVHLSALGEHSDLSLSAVRHHLRVLDRANLVETEKVRGKRRFYPVGTDETARAAALSDPAVRRLLEALAALGEARNDRLADELNRSPSTVSHHLSSLEDDGLVVRERDGRATVNRLAPTVAGTFGETDADGGTPVERPHSDD